MLGFNAKTASQEDLPLEKAQPRSAKNVMTAITSGHHTATGDEAPMAVAAHVCPLKPWEGGREGGREGGGGREVRRNL